MSQTTCPLPPFASKEEFFTRGLTATTDDGPLDCSICREPLSITDTPAVTIPPSSRLPGVDSTCLPRLTINQDTKTTCFHPTDHLQGYIVSTQTQHTVSSQLVPDTATDPIPEPAIRVQPCHHIFGTTCLNTWFSTTTSNCCPSCNLILFPEQHIHLAFREPTRAMRRDFVYYVEHVFEDLDFAQSMREELMGERVRFLMRELAIGLWSSQGFEVTWGYVDHDLDGNEFDEENDKDYYEEGITEDEDEEHAGEGDMETENEESDKHENDDDMES